MVGGILAFIYKRHAKEWEILAGAYGREWFPPLSKKQLQSLILYRKGQPARSYAAIVTIGVYEDGIGFRFFAPLAPFHAPVFVPHSDIKGWKQNWYINSDSVELAFARTPDMQLIMPASQMNWISAATNGQVSVSSDPVPNKNWPTYTFLLAVGMGVMAVLVMVMAVYRFMAP